LLLDPLVPACLSLGKMHLLVDWQLWVQEAVLVVNVRPLVIVESARERMRYVLQVARVNERHVRWCYRPVFLKHFCV